MRSVLCRLAPLVALVAGCKSRPPATPVAGPPPVVRVEQLEYVDTDAFDLLFETTLRNAHPVVVVQTDYAKPEWGPRLNAWIAAWNAGGRGDVRRVRGQVPGAAGVVVDGDSVRELRLLIDDLMDRAEASARLGTRWWAEHALRDRRVALLRPYNLRFHGDAGGRIQLIFFHGAYAAHYKSIVNSLTGTAGGESDEWSRGYFCSHTQDSTK